MKIPIKKTNGDIEADVVIVGSGVVGAMIADQLARQGHSVLILEAGPIVERAQVVDNFRNLPFDHRLIDKPDYQTIYPQTPYALAPLYFPDNNYISLSGPDSNSFKQYYLRAVGGTTWHWAGSNWRHLPVDFVLNSTYGVGRDWPISYDELEPYYCRAEEEMGISGPHDPALQSPTQRSRPYLFDMIPRGYADNYVASVVNPHGYHFVPVPQARSVTPWEGRPACCGSNNCQPICPIGAMYAGIQHVQKAERNGALVLAESVAYKIDTDHNNKVTAVHWYDAKRQSHRASGTVFVLACNAIETPRLLLQAANQGNPNGIANSSDQVGRNMMDHTGFYCSFLADKPIWGGRGPQENSSMVGMRDSPTRSDHSSFSFIFDNRSRVPNATQQALDMGLVGVELDEEIRRRVAFGIYITVMMEPLPDANNRLTLSNTRFDGLGLACPDIHYDTGDYVRRGAVAARERLRHLSGLFNGVEFHTSPFNGNNHLMGSTIMGDDPKTSVVDGDCRAHDHANLWLPGGSAMPSGSVVNSTLTMVALGLKAADSISSTLAGN